MLCFGFRAACIAQIITGLVPCGIIVPVCYLFEVVLNLLFRFQPCVLYSVRPRAFTLHAIICVQ